MQLEFFIECDPEFWGARETSDSGGENCMIECGQYVLKDGDDYYVSTIKFELPKKKLEELLNNRCRVKIHEEEHYVCDFTSFPRCTSKYTMELSEKESN